MTCALEILRKRMHFRDNLNSFRFLDKVTSLGPELDLVQCFPHNHRQVAFKRQINLEKDNDHEKKQALKFIKLIRIVKIRLKRAVHKSDNKRTNTHCAPRPNAARCRKILFRSTLSHRPAARQDTSR